MTTLQDAGHLAIHRRAEEINFLKHRLCTLKDINASTLTDLQAAVLTREQALADELLHTRQIEPLGETLQRRLAMAERICRDLSHQESQDYSARAYRVAETERLALAEMLKQWWAWLRGP